MRRTKSRWALACCAALILAVALWAGGSTADADSDGRDWWLGQRLAVPAYWTPDAAGSAMFDQLVAGAPRVGLVVVNGPTSSAPKPFDPATAAQISKLHHAGVTVLGYVDTGYLGRTGMTTTRVSAGSTDIAAWRAQAVSDAADWVRLYGQYGLDGIFLDQTPAECGPDDAYVDEYHRIADTLRWRHLSDAFVALNPGTAAHECYAEVADALVIFENTYAEYRTWAPPAWVYNHPRRRFWHLVHTTGQEEMRAAMAASRERHAGLVYVTNLAITATGTPWAALPPEPYWQDLLTRVAPAAR